MWFVVPQSGTDQFSGLRREGGFVRLPLGHSGRGFAASESKASPQHGIGSFPAPQKMPTTPGSASECLQLLNALTGTWPKACARSCPSAQSMGGARPTWRQKNLCLYSGILCRQEPGRPCPDP
jgi:hypothetical protein